MADRGTPIPIATRLEIRDRRTQETPQPIRKIAESLDISTATARKYAKEFATKPLNGNKGSASV